VNDEVRKIIGNIDGLNEMWSTMEKCCKRPEKYISEALGPVIEFRKYTMSDSAASREFFSLLKAATKGGQGGRSRETTHQ
jgi:hypothetical protein